MDDEDLKQIAAWMEASGIAEIEIESGGRTIRLVVGGSGTTEPVGAIPAAVRIQTRAIKAQGIGTVLLTHPLRGQPFVSTGDAVKEGDIVALLKVGTAYAPVVAMQDGVISAVLAEAGQRAGYDTPLFSLA